MTIDYPRMRKESVQIQTRVAMVRPGLGSSYGVAAGGVLRGLAHVGDGVRDEKGADGAVAALHQVLHTVLKDSEAAHARTDENARPRLVHFIEGFCIVTRVQFCLLQGFPSRHNCILDGVIIPPFILSVDVPENQHPNVTRENTPAGEVVPHQPTICTTRPPEENCTQVEQQQLMFQCSKMYLLVEQCQ